MFHRLSQEDIARIVDIQVDQLAARLAERSLQLELTPAARDTSPRSATTPTSVLVRSSGCCNVRSQTRSHWSC